MFMILWQWRILHLNVVICNICSEKLVCEGWLTETAAYKCLGSALRKLTTALSYIKTLQFNILENIFYLTFFFYSCCSHMEHRASEKHFVSLQCLSLKACPHYLCSCSCDSLCSRVMWTIWQVTRQAIRAARATGLWGSACCRYINWSSVDEDLRAQVKARRVSWRARAWARVMWTHLKRVRRTPWTGDQPITRLLPNTNTDIHALHQVRIHDPSVWGSEGISYLKLRSQWSALLQITPTKFKKLIIQ
jgi:hypothetical protein